MAFRALAYLETLPPGSEVMTSALAEAIGADASQIQACLQSAEEAGLVYFRRRDDLARSPRWWSLTDHNNRVPAQVSQSQQAPQIEQGPVTKDDQGFRACLWTNGVLQIEREPGDLVLIAPPHVEQLRKLLTGGAL